MQVTTHVEVRDELDIFLQQELSKELLRFTTAGSVDDGKSTLIGRLLHDCKAVYEDQLDSVKKSRINRSGKAIDFSLLTDGLRAEREQGITIDVAYRFFSTPRRKFIIADTPGHEQYTRNMATGASTADLAVILIDATKGLLPQTRRHVFIASLLGISTVLAAVNKMDLVAHNEDVFSRLRDDFTGLAKQLGIPYVQCIPISALDGDNIVARSANTPWYGGPTLLEHLETVTIRPAIEMDALRFPIQSVIRPDANFRGFAGRVASGTIHPGDEVLALPSKQRTKIESVVTYDGELETAHSSQSVVVKLADEIDLSRGDLLSSPDSLPHVSNRFGAMVVWLHGTPLELNRSYLAKHGGRHVKAKVTRIRFRVDINNLDELPASQLAMNEIASVEFETSHALYFDTYELNRTTGSLILIDPFTNATVGAVMIREDLSHQTQKEKEKESKVTLKDRILSHGHGPAILTVCGERERPEDFERLLLEHGFETALIHYPEIPAPARRALINTLWQLGLVIILWSESKPRPRDHGFFREVAGQFYFDLSEEIFFSDAAAGARRVLDIGETLRVAQENADRGGI